jgi:hypothetical protein
MVMEMTMAEQKTVTPGGSLDKLAKLLAAENIMVEHKPIKTAYFDVKNRVLALPMWKEMTESLYHMLVLHEVGHALDTPADGWKGAIDKVKEQESAFVAQTFHGYLNVVEDARIERRIKTKFPGSRRDFIDGYNWLHEQDFFSIKNENVDSLSLIDRINLYFKLGTRLHLKFTDEERVFVRRAEQTITFDDVAKLAEDIFAYAKKKREEEAEQEEQSLTILIDYEDGEESDDFDDFDEDEAEDSDEDEGGRSCPKNRDDDDRSDDGTGIKGGRSSKPVDQAKTDSAMNDRMEELLDEKVSGRSFTYVMFPKDITHEEFVVPYKNVIKLAERDFNDCRNRAKVVEYRNWLYNRFRAENNSAINYMVKEFEMKKAAVAYSRSKQAKTGVIDTNKLHGYKFNDDIFKRLTIEPTGKNHGVVVILDMSGSMISNYKGAMDQLICLAMFCRRVGIPHRIYGFTQVTDEFNRFDGTRTPKKADLFNRVSRRLGDKSFVFPDMGFDLVEFFHESMSLKEFNTMVGTLLLSSKMQNRYYSDDFLEKKQLSDFLTQNVRDYYSGFLHFLQLGGTPLNDALLVSRDLLAKFRKEKNIQIMNFVCITDGESNGSSYYTPHRIPSYPHKREHLHCRSNKYEKNTNIFIDEESRIQTMVQFQDNHEITAMFARTVSKSQNATFVGFYIVNGSYDVRGVAYRYAPGKNTDEFMAKWKKSKGEIAIDGMLNFDVFYIILGGKSLEAQQATFEEAKDLKKGQLAKAFISAQTKRGVSRVVLGKFIEKIAA